MRLLLVSGIFFWKRIDVWFFLMLVKARTGKGEVEKESVPSRLLNTKINA
jgi:hypothetical protein